MYIVGINSIIFHYDPGFVVVTVRVPNCGILYVCLGETVAIIMSHYEVTEHR